MKGYRRTIVVSLLLTVMAVCMVRGTVVQDVERKWKLIPSLKNTDMVLPLKNVPEQILYRKGYMVSYNKETKLPNWVAWHLTADHVNGEARRPGNAWHEDNDVPLPRATNSDYKKAVGLMDTCALSATIGGMQARCMTVFYTRTAVPNIMI